MTYRLFLFSVLPIVIGIPCALIMLGTVFPRIWMWMIPLSIGGTELAPIFLGLGLIVVCLAVWPNPTHPHWRWVAIGLGTISVVVAGRTILQIPGAVSDANQQMNTVMKIISPGSAPDNESERFPIVWSALITGLSVPSIAIDRRVEISDRSGVMLYADIYHPAGPGPHPIVLVLHGGGWSGGDRTEASPASKALAAAGFVVVATDYRLAPAHHYPEQITDVLDSLTWIRQRAPQWRADPTRIALLGRSAGSQLAILTASNPAAGITSVVAFYSPVDFVVGWKEPGWPDPLHAREIFTDYFGGTYDELPERYREASPIAHTDRPLPPTLLISGGRDQLVDLSFSRQLAERLTAGGTPNALVTIPWAEHAFDLIPQGIGSQIALHQVIRFLKLTLGTAASTHGP